MNLFDQRFVSETLLHWKQDPLLVEHATRAYFLFHSSYILHVFVFRGMYKSNGRCIFCPSGTYSNGTSAECLPCASKLSLVPGLYYKNWNELPMYLNRSYMAFDDVETSMFFNVHPHDSVDFAFSDYTCS